MILYKNVVFVIPPNDNVSKDYLPPLGVLYLAAVLKREGIGVSVIDMPIEQGSYEDVIERVSSEDFDLVCITSVSDSRFNAIRLIENISKPIVLGGVHFTYSHIESVKSFDNVLAVIRYEGEESLLKICMGEKLEDIAGITFMKDGEVKVNPDASPVDIGSVPWPARELVPMDKYSAVLEGENKTRCTSVITSRGCPNNCVFCANATFWKRRMRFRNPKDVVDEIEHIVKTYGIRGIDFWDDTFTVSKRHVSDICNEILKRGLKIKFYARIRVNTVDEDILKLMKKAGCVALSWGVETGSPRILKVIQKNITFRQVFDVTKIANRLGFKSKAFFMFNHPEETYRDLIKTFRLMHLLRKKYGIATPVGICTVYPGTFLEADMRKRGLIKPDFNWNKYRNRWQGLVGMDPKKLYYKNMNVILVYVLYTLYFKIFFRILDILGR